MRLTKQNKEHYKTASSFGVFIRDKRIQNGMSMREFVRLINVSPVYTSNIENGFRSAPIYAVLNRMANVLAFNENEQDMMYDLAAKTKSGDSLDLNVLNYAGKSSIIIKALRVARKYKADVSDWQMYIDFLINILIKKII